MVGYLNEILGIRDDQIQLKVELHKKANLKQQDTCILGE